MTSPNSALVIGGAGFIGRSVCNQLLAAGRDVTIVGRRPKEAHSHLPPCRYVSADFGNRAQLRELLEPGCEVIDLAYATVPKTSYGDPVFDLLSNLPASVALLQEAHSKGVHRLLLVSSGGTVYGSAKQLPIAETHPTAPLSPYGITKLTIDHYAQMFHHTMDLPVVVVRPANAYGPQQRTGTGQGFLAAAIDSVLGGRPVDIYGASGTIRDYIHVNDVASGILAVLREGKAGSVYNVGTGIGHSNLQVVELLKHLACPLGYNLETRHLPERRFDVEASILDSTKLQVISGWKASVALAEGLKEMWNSIVESRPSV